MTVHRAPSGFRAVGHLEWAAFCRRPPGFKRATTRSGRRLQGIRYERKAQEFMRATHGDLYLDSPWLSFREAGGGPVRYAQPDGLLLDPEARWLTIVEYKYQHCEKAWWQMKKLYTPLLQRILPAWPLRYVEVVKWYDPTTSFPEKTFLIPDLANPPPFGVGVHIWTP